jgi:hypothetical protein
MGGAVCDTTTTGSSNTALTTTYIVTLGPKDRLNLYFAELIAISTVLQYLAALQIRHRVITILSSNLSVLQVINHPKQQSGQSHICQIYKSADRLKETGNQVFAIWAPAHEEVTLKAKAKAMARQATGPRREVQERTLSAKATALHLAKQKHQGKPIEGIGEYIRKLDTALPGKHTRLLYNSFKRTEAVILAQLYTGIVQLNRYLHRIGAAEMDLYTCGQAKETVEYFLFRCSCWNQYRKRMLQQTDTKIGCLSFCLGGKALSDPPSWKPNLAAVRATVQYTIATGRLVFEN